MAGGERPEAQVARHVAAGAGRSDLTSGAAQVLQRAGARGPPSRPGSAQHTRVSPHTPHGLLARRPERSRAGPARARVPGRGSHAAALTATRPTRGAAGLCTRLTAGPAARRPEVRPGTYTCRPPRRRRQHTRARQQPRARPGPRSAAALTAPDPQRPACQTQTRGAPSPRPARHRVPGGAWPWR